MKEVIFLVEWILTSISVRRESPGADYQTVVETPSECSSPGLVQCWIESRLLVNDKLG